MNKTLENVGMMSIFIALLIFSIIAVLLWDPSKSGLEPAELYEKVNIVNGVALIFAIQGGVCWFLSKLQFT